MEKITAGYLRVSTEEQASSGTSLETQENEIRRWAEYEGRINLRLYSDGGFSGKNDQRPRLQELLIDVRAGRVSAVVVAKLDRLARNLRLLLNITHEFAEHGVGFVSLHEKFDTGTPSGRLALNVMAAIGEFEREAIVERTREGRHRRYEHGEWGPGQPPYGFKYDPQTRMLEIEPGEAEVVRRIYNLYVYQRLGLQRIALALNRDGVPPRQRGKRWHKTAVLDIIRHAGYKGEHPTGAKCPSIIEPDVWELAKKRRGDNPHLHNRRDSPWLLQGVVRCGECGHPLACAYSHGKRRVYSCRGRLRLERPGDIERCSLKPVDADRVESEVWEKVKESVSDPNALRRELDSYIKTLTARKVELEKSILPVETRLAEVREQLSRLAEDFVVSRLKPEKLAGMRTKLEDEEKRLESVKTEIDPAQLDELEETRTYLKYWELHRDKFELAQSFVLESGNPEEDRAEQKEAARPYNPARGAEYDKPELGKFGFPGTRRQLLDKLQTQIVCFHDRTEIRAIIPVPDIIQESNPAYRSGRCPRFQ